MKATELMIGDWLNTNRSECVADYAYQKWQQVGKVKYTQEDVVAVRFDDEDDWEEFSLNEVNPIPLTEEILAKNGFTYEEDTFLPDTGYWSLSDEDGLLYFTINAFGIKGSGEVAFGYQDIALKYVHQLQHLLRLCGLQKEIEQ